MGTDQKTRHFLLVGNGPYLNRGCEAIVRGTVESLRREFGDDVAVTVASFGDPEVIAKQAATETDPYIKHIRLPIARRLSIPWFIAHINRLFGTRIKPYGLYKCLDSDLKTADAVLEVGGDNYSLDYGLPEAFLNLDKYVQSFGVPVVIWGASVGPFDALPKYEKRMGKHLRSLGAIFARETATIDYLKKLSTGNLHRVCDPAFLMKSKKPELDIPSGYIGINFSQLVVKYMDKGIEEWRKLCAEMVSSVIRATGRSVLLIPHVMSNEDSDWEFLQSVASQLPAEYAERVTCVPGTLSAEELKWVISRCTVFAGARTHSTIAALSTCTPTLSLAYSLKAVGLNKDIFNSLDYCINIKELTPESVSAKLKDMLDHEEEIRAHLNSVIPAMVEKSLQAGPLLRRVVENRSR